MAKIRVALEVDAFLAGLEKQVAAEQLKQQDVSSYRAWKKPEPNDYGRGDYDGHEVGCSTQSVVADGSYGKKRRKSRWGPQEGEGDGNDIEDSGSKKRKSRWVAQELKVPLLSLGQIQMPDFIKELTGGLDLDPEQQALNIKLLEINRKLQIGMVLDPVGDVTRSPSPEPIYNNMGVRINTRKDRTREKLTRERQEVIAMLIMKNPAFKPPLDYKPLKHYKKLYIPVKEYPGYNFMGLVIGPRGNTQKQMEKETGAKIVIRGRGSVREGRSAKRGRDLKPDSSENEDLHVLVEADTEEALKKAASMVEKLLIPVEEGRNEHKKVQLRTLAILNGTLRDEEHCRLCGEPGHRQYACPARHSTFKSDVLCRICGDGNHSTIDCPLKGSAQGNKMDDEYKNFLAELGGGGLDGFVKYVDLSSATAAETYKNGCQSEGRVFAMKDARPAPLSQCMGGSPGGPPQGGRDPKGADGYPPQLPLQSGPPRGPLGDGYMAPLLWIAPPRPTQQHNPYSPLRPGPNYYSLPYNSNAYGPPPLQGQGHHESSPSIFYGAPYKNYTGEPPPQGGPQGQQGGMDQNLLFHSNVVESEYERFMSEMGR